jgi:hypothetical protein
MDNKIEITADVAKLIGHEIADLLRVEFKTGQTWSTRRVITDRGSKSAEGLGRCVADIVKRIERDNA